MSLKTLLTAMKEYLECERELEGCLDDPGRRRSLRAGLEVASLKLEKELKAYEREREGYGVVGDILVAVDESAQAQWALEEAVRLAHGIGARVSLIYVVLPTPALTPEFDVEVAQQSDAVFGRGLMQNMSQQVPAEMLGEKILVIGAAGPQILAAAIRLNAGMIVIGTHGRGLLGRVLLGSVAEAVIRAATCPVLTVSHPRRREVKAGVQPYSVAPVADEGSSLVF